MSEFNVEAAAAERIEAFRSSAAPMLGGLLSKVSEYYYGKASLSASLTHVGQCPDISCLDPVHHTYTLYAADPSTMTDARRCANDESTIFVKETFAARRTVEQLMRRGYDVTALTTSAKPVRVGELVAADDEATMTVKWGTCFLLGQTASQVQRVYTVHAFGTKGRRHNLVQHTRPAGIVERDISDMTRMIFALSNSIISIT